MEMVSAMKKENLVKEIERILTEVEKAENDQKAIKLFWRAVGIAKRHDVPEKSLAVKLEKIHQKLTSDRMVFGFKEGSAVIITLLIINFALLRFTIHSDSEYKFPAFLILLIFSVYGIFLTGRILASLITGIKLKGYYFYNPVELGMILDYSSYLMAGQKRRVLFFLTPIVFEFCILTLMSVLLWYSGFEYFYIPVLVALLGLLGMFTGWKFAKTGELYRFVREYRIFKDIQRIKK